MTEPLLQVDGLTVDFPGPQGLQRVVAGIDFAIGPGERFALVGESGSGKSVTAQTLMRLHDHTRVAGTIRFGGMDLVTASAAQLRAIRGREIAMIFQEPMSALNPLYSIGDQISEILVVHKGTARAQARRESIALLDRCRIHDAARRYDSLPHQLSGGQRQRAMIAMALACDPKLVIADEPTTALDLSVQAQIMELLAELQRERAMAILLITHDLPLVRAFADRVGVMQNGRIVESGDVATVFEAPRDDYTRRLLDARPGRMVSESGLPAEAAGPVLSTRGLRCEFGARRWWSAREPFVALDGVDLDIPPGRTLGVVGESGSGKTTLAMAILQLAAGRTRGEVSIDGQRLDTLSPERLRPLRRQLQMVFQDPFNSLSPRLTIGRIVGEGLELHRPELDAQARRAEIATVLQEVGLDPAFVSRYPHEFSGGQRQRIAIARALVLRPRVLLLDEPTSALDVSVQLQVLQLLVALQKRHGLSYLLITHDLAVIRAIAHRVLVLKDGKVVESGTVEQVFTAAAHDYTRSLLAALRKLEAA